jgi:hypothetical protein
MPEYLYRFRSAKSFLERKELVFENEFVGITQDLILFFKVYASWVLLSLSV